MPLQASAVPGRGDGLAAANGVALSAGDDDPSGPTLGAADVAASLPPEDGPGAEVAPDAAGEPGDGGAVEVAPHAATSTATPSIATIRVARPGRGRVVATPGA